MSEEIARDEIKKAAPGLSVANAANAQSANIAKTVQNGSIGTEKFAGSIPAAGVTDSGNQTIPSLTLTELTFDSERYDTANMHSTGILADTARLTAPATGIYEINAAILWEFNANGPREVSFAKNDTTFLGQEEQSAGVSGQVISRTVRLQAGDFVKVLVRQSSGGDLDVLKSDERSPEFSLTWLTPGP